MNKEQLFESMSGIDEQILQRSERAAVKHPTAWRYLLPVAACLCFLIAVGTAIPGLLADPVATPGLEAPPIQNTNAVEETTQAPAYALDVYYNHPAAVLSADRAAIAGYFTEELSVQEIEEVTPGKQHEWMRYSGTAGFNGAGELIHVLLQVTTTLPDRSVEILLGDRSSCCVTEPSTILSQCGDMEYVVYQWDTGAGNVALNASAEIEGIPLEFTMTAPKELLSTAKADFEAVLECFAWYAEGKPNLAAVTATVIPEWFDNQITLAEAAQDADFGSLMPGALPSGFAEESVRRYKDQNNDYLSGLWTRGMDEIYWNVSYYEEADGIRLTGVEDTKNYDLSLYPVPRAESVPPELHEIVDDPIFLADELTLEAVWARAYTIEDEGDTEGWRMAFSVKYENTLVSIRTKGVDPQWVYDRLVELVS